MSVLSDFNVKFEQIATKIMELNQQRPEPPTVRVGDVILRASIWDNGLSMAVDLFVRDAHKISLSAETISDLYEALGQLLNDQPAGVES
jgi:hypothetical protein